MTSTVQRLRAVQDDPRWILLLLRGYLGFTFVYAGLSKIGGHDFLDSAAPTSMHATLLAVKSQSPIGGLLGPVESHSFAFGLLIALGETAVGIGILLGLFARLAAVGGMLISLSLFLTVSWNATPWYTGADIVYLFAFTPVLLGGAGPLSADEWLAAARARDTRAGAVARDQTRRVILGGLAGGAGLVAAGIAGLVRKSSEPASAGGASSPGTAGTSTPAVTSSSAAPSSAAGGGPVLIAASKVPVGGAVEAQDPKTGRPVYVLQLRAGDFTALDPTCPHAGCQVSFVSSSAGFTCPCHQSTFAASGAVTQGPATSGLKKVAVTERGGNVTLT